MQRLRASYGHGPLLLRIPVRSQALILAPAHVHQVLNNSPEPFAVASSEKRSAMAHFQPQGVLISHGSERADRRLMLAALLDGRQMRLQPPRRLDPQRPLPATLNNYALRFSIAD
jgi:hypothetical protein